MYIFDNCQSELPVSVAPRSTTAPVRPRCPSTLAFVSSNRPMCVLAPQKCAGYTDALRNCAVAWPCFPGNRALKAAHSPSGRGFGDRQSFFVIFGFKCGFQALFGSSEPRQMRTVVQKIGRLVLRMFCRALGGGFRTHAFLKSTCTTLTGVGWCRWSWSGLPVVGESAAPDNHLL